MEPRKYAIVGSSSAGKTTLVYQVAGLLKVAGVHVETIISGDRRIPFPPELLEESLDAQAFVILNQARLESERACQPGIDVILSDRSVLDFMAYTMVTVALLSERNVDLLPIANVQWWALRHFVENWARTYNHLFYLPMRATYDDGERRPPLEFATRADQLIRYELSQARLPVTFLLSGGRTPDVVAQTILRDANLRPGRT
jgi:predicted ATPase